MATTKKLEHRKLGGLPVSAIGLGCMSLSGIYGAAEDATSEALIRHAIDAGVDHLDSSDMYGWGHNEEVVGRAIKGRRDSVVLATKFGQTKREGQSNGVNGRPEYVMAACEASLKRLGEPVIDLYYQHRVDPDVPVEETVGAMARLVEQGKVRFLGLSEANPDRIRRAHAVHPIAAVQTEYSLLYRAEAEETRATTRELGIGFVAYAPLGRGFLTGAIQNFSDIDGRRAVHPLRIAAGRKRRRIGGAADRCGREPDFHCDPGRCRGWHTVSGGGHEDGLYLRALRFCSCIVYSKQLQRRSDIACHG
jgi:aryl-alcohol dehydrogenase-like predicted oxidoreductase